MGVLTHGEIEAIGFFSVGRNVQISDKACFYGVDRIKIGNNVRIDDFCVLSAGDGGIIIGDYIHISVYSSIIGRGQVTINDFCNISSRVSIYSSSDDYSGATLTNPTIPEQYKNVNHSSVFLGRHVIVGSGTVILPGVKLNDGVAVGALSLVKNNCEAFGVYAGNPLRKIKDRKRDLLAGEGIFLASNRL